MARRYYSSTAARTTLASGVDDSTTTLSVVAVSGWPASYPYTLVIDQDTVNEELVSVTNRSGTTLTVTRGIDGTSAVAHDAGAAVNHGVSAQDFDEPNAFINGTGVVTETLLASDSVTSAKIVDGTIVNADVNASAAIAQSKIADLTSDLASKVDYALPVNAQTGTTYTFVLADAEKLTTASNAAAVTLTIPPQSSVTWLDNTVLRVVNYGAGAVTVDGGSGVTVTNTATTIAQYGAAVAIRTGSDAWTLVPFGGGDVPPATVSSPAATGQYTDSGVTYDYYTFTASGTLTVDTAGFADILVIAGGGSGGRDSNGAARGAGGGGAGGYLEIANAYLPSGSLTITVGAGGSGNSADNALNTPGNASRIGGLYFAIGGGGGFNHTSFSPYNLTRTADGGSGGGRSSFGGAGNAGNGVADQGNNGGAGADPGYSGGGGGGANAVGGNGSGSTGGAGGAGKANSYTGSSVTRGGGGGGSSSGTAGAGGAGGGGAANNSGNGTAGTANTGGGGGASRLNTSGNGGSGVVIIRVKV